MQRDVTFKTRAVRHWIKFFLRVLLLGSAAPLGKVSFAADPFAVELFRWSLPEQEIDDVRFSQDGRWITFATQMAVPDGHDAEEYDEIFGTGWMTLLKKRAETEPRFQDPVVHVLNDYGQSVCEVGYGWNPDVRGRDPEVVFSYQTHPITNLRRLAETLQGNTIQFFNCESNARKALASSASGYLDAPIFIGDSVYFTKNEPVNGSYGGPVGLSIASLDSGTVKDILVPRRKNNFFYLLSDIQSTKAGIRYTVSEPKPAPGDEYMASDYVLVRYERDDVTGRIHEIPLPKPTESEGSEGESPARATSPDGTFMIVEEPHPGTDATEVDIRRVSDHKRLMRINPKGVIRGFYWSSDGSRLAVVFTKIGDFSGPGIGKFHFLHDEIVVYRRQAEAYGKAD